MAVAGAEVTVDDDGSFRISILLDSIPEGEELVHKALEIVSTDAAGNSKTEVIDVYRLKQEEQEEGFFDYESSQYTVLLLAILILAGAMIAAALLMRTMSRNAKEQELTEEYDEFGGM